jgi:endonuclease-3
MHNRQLTRKIITVYRILKKLYGTPKKRRLDPLDELIMTILSQNTSNRNSVPAFYSLKKGFKTWENVRVARPAAIARLIKRGGLANIKARRIKEVLGAIKERQGRLDISFLKSLSAEEGSDYLRSLKGVGPKTASVVLLFSFGKPVMPVDTHIFRVAKRMGILGKKTSIEQAHIALTAAMPPLLIHDFHINMIEHGRQVCKAPRPLCDICGAKRICAYYIACQRR